MFLRVKYNLLLKKKKRVSSYLGFPSLLSTEITSTLLPKKKKNNHAYMGLGLFLQNILRAPLPDPIPLISMTFFYISCLEFSASGISPKCILVSLLYSFHFRVLSLSTKLEY